MRGASPALVALAAFFWGLSGGIGGMLMAAGWDAFAVAFYRGAIGLLFILAWLSLHPQGHGLTSHRLWFWSTVAGLGAAGNFAFYFVSIQHGSLAVAATLMYCAPLYVYLVCFALRLEQPSALKWTAIAVVILGMGLLTEVHDIGANGITPIGIGAGLLAGLCYALFIFGFKYAAPHGSPQAILSIAFLVLACVLIWPADREQILAVLSTADWPLFAALGVLGAGVSFVVYIYGLKKTSPALASMVAMIEPVTASLFGLVLLDESLVLHQGLGMGLILITITALSVYSSGRRPLSRHSVFTSRHGQ